MVFVERQPAAARSIQQHLQEWGAGDPAHLPGTGEVVGSDALAWLARYSGPAFDVVFVDPPFASPALATAVVLLARAGMLAPDAQVYLEAAAGAPLPPLPPGWSMRRQGTAGEVGYHLAAASSSDAGRPETQQGERE